MVSTGHRLLLVDDDPVFGKILKQEAKNHDVSVIVCISLNNPELLHGQKFDAAVIDYDLGDITGPELSQSLAATLGDIPILVISGKPRPDVAGLGGNIKGFIQKDRGYKMILEAALKLLTPTK